MKKILIVAIILLAGIVAVTVWPKAAAEVQEIQEVKVAEAKKPELSHSQKVWLGALEWCESRGNPEAINEVDLDGTASYGAFQFKPSTFAFFSAKYGIEKTDLMNRDEQYAVVEQMVLHYNEINWERQFPGCVAKLGRPPRN